MELSISSSIKSRFDIRLKSDACGLDEGGLANQGWNNVAQKFNPVFVMLMCIFQRWLFVIVIVCMQWWCMFTSPSSCICAENRKVRPTALS